MSNVRKGRASFRFWGMGLWMLVALLALIDCGDKGQEPSEKFGHLMFTVEPDPLPITSEPGEYTIAVKGRETGGVAVDMLKVTVVLTYLDDSPIMAGPQNLTEVMFTWEVTDPELEGGAMTGLLTELWHFNPQESKTFQFPIRIGTDISAPEGFAGLYLQVAFLQLAVVNGKEGFKATLTYEAQDANGHPLKQALALGMRMQS